MGLGTVAITGAAGAIGSVVREGLQGQAEHLVLLDRVRIESSSATETAVQLDLLDPTAVERALDGVDVVLHLGGLPDEAPLPDLLAANVLGTHHVLEGCRRQGIQRVVLAGSNRLTGFHPNSHLIGTDAPVRPDGLYGVSKVAVEALGQLYADKFDLSVLCLRIGSFEEAPTERRHLATWLSHRDAIGYVRAALDAPRSPGFTAVYAVSANTRRFWKLPDLDTLAYTPLDDAETYAARIPGSDTPLDPHDPQGGPYTEPAFTLKHIEY
ncbi:NAD-dependent epimerase/dehydratase family protein [Streptomyces sp. H39-S7]|uniref:NAD-dependent epimerase/dehydratase family protein n=1 Tax=Streptomyces sp. H39-S7 TaxID=3004357 RepID=UPI0022B04CC3|nr:NAD(P)-dependent oxidoreductase [Streptomyces sp. H39-S7]MCZ4125231.1 NAD(P)-dependent oxidoreductase [Streptomyces sp. H39-S7]